MSLTPTVPIPQGQYEVTVPLLMRSAGMCSGVTIVAINELARGLDELWRENQELRALMERPRPPVARDFYPIVPINTEEIGEGHS